jgi:type I pantothenate kinase
VSSSSKSSPKNQGNLTPFVKIDRSDWSRLGTANEQPLTESEISQIRGLGDFLDLQEVSDVYLPLSRFLNIYVSEYSKLHRATSDFLGERAKRVPFIIGVAGSVAVGKSTVSRLLRELLARWEGTPKVELITTDGFLYPNAELEKRSLMHRKGFPESYDRLALIQFVSDIKSGKENVSAPVYSHLSYDIMPGEQVTVSSPDVVIIEGLNVLQGPGLDQEITLSDFFDFKIYVDADTKNITKWFLNRFHALRESAFANPESYFHRYSQMPIDEALVKAEEIWKTINLPNLTQNILPTRSRATLVLNKGDNHKVESVLLRKL